MDVRGLSNSLLPVTVPALQPTNGNAITGTNYRPLTQEDVQKQTHIKVNAYNLEDPSSNSTLIINVPLRFLNNGKMYWVESNNVANLAARVDFTNEVVEKVRKLVPERSDHLTIISMGAGSLLHDHFIYQQLENAGYTDINYRAIDPGYLEQREEFPLCNYHDIYRYAKAIRSQFSADKQVAFFVSGNEYLLKKTADGCLLAEQDRARGPVIQLAICPTLPPSALRPHLPNMLANSTGEYVYLTGRLVEAGQANCIYIFGCRVEEFSLEKIKRSLEHSDGTLSPITIKLTINPEGKLVLEYPGDVSVFRDFVTIIKNKFDNNKYYSLEKIDDLHQSLDETIAQINTFIKDPQGVKYCFQPHLANEFDRDFERIGFFFNPILIATLDQDKIFTYP